MSPALPHVDLVAQVHGDEVFTLLHGVAIGGLGPADLLVHAQHIRELEVCAARSHGSGLADTDEASAARHVLAEGGDQV